MKGLDPARADLARPLRRPLADARRRGVPGVRARAPVIVRWGLDELDGLLAELAIERPFVVASERWNDLPLPGVGRWSEVPTDRIAEVAAAAGGRGRPARRRRRQRDRPGQGRLRRDRPAARLGADDLLGRRVDGLLRRPRPRPPDEGRRRRSAPRRDRLRAAADARPAARPERRDGAERARALCRGALRGRPQPRGRSRGARGREADRRGAAAGARRRPRSRSPHPAARRRPARRRRARLGGAGARTRDGPGARRPLRDRARRGERAHACRRRCASTSRSPPRRSAASARRSASTTRPPGSRSSPAPPASRASASSACPRTSSTRSPPPWSSAPARRRTRARRARPRSRSFCARSGDARRCRRAAPPHTIAAMLLSEVGYARPATLEQALGVLADYPGARALAGGQTLVNVMKARAAAPDVLVDLAGIPELKGIELGRRRDARARRDGHLQRADRVGRGAGAAHPRRGLRPDRGRAGPQPRHDRRQRLLERSRRTTCRRCSSRSAPTFTVVGPRRRARPCRRRTSSSAST